MINDDIIPYLAAFLTASSAEVPTKEELRLILQRYQMILELLTEIHHENPQQATITTGSFSFV